MEHFYTIQGEGAHSGRAAYFIRLGGCDVGCHWCDVKESWDATLHPLMDAEEIAAIAAKHCKTIIITGGEPLMWDLNILTKKLKELGCTIHVETSGSHNLRGHIDWITLSPKKVKLPKKKFTKRLMKLKVVISTITISNSLKNKLPKYQKNANYTCNLSGAKGSKLSKNHRLHSTKS